MTGTHHIRLHPSIILVTHKTAGATCLGQSRSCLFFNISLLLLNHDLFTVDDIQAGLGRLLIESAAIQHIPVCG